MPHSKEKELPVDILGAEGVQIPAETVPIQQEGTPQASEGAGFGMEPAVPGMSGAVPGAEVLGAPAIMQPEAPAVPDQLAATPEAPVLPQPDPQEAEPLPPTPETIGTSEQEASQIKHQAEGVAPLEAATLGVKASKKKKSVQDGQTTTAGPKTQTRQDIEAVLSEGLTELYQSMTPQEQQIFREKGEEAASKIEVLVLTFRASAKKVVEIIRSWLATIPRVNRYFLEQESKLKTDDIIKLQRKLKKDKRIQNIKTE